MKKENLNKNGWIKLYRDLLDKPIWLLSTPEQKTILITLLLMANHSENEWEFKGVKHIVEPGQFITSLDSIKEKAGKGISIQNIRTALQRFEKYEFLTSDPTNKNRLITICNWDSYQAEKDEANKQINKQLTSNQQAANKQLTTNKNDKNNKNDNKSKVNKSTRFSPPTIDEIKDYCVKRNNSVDANNFFDFYESNGWLVGKNKMKDWKASVRTWENRENNKYSSNNGNGKTTPTRRATEILE